MNNLMISWVVGQLPDMWCHALVCSAGVKGYAAVRRSLEEAGYPEHTILLTNVDIRDIPPLPSSPCAEDKFNEKEEQEVQQQDGIGVDPQLLLAPQPAACVDGIIDVDGVGEEPPYSRLLRVWEFAPETNPTDNSPSQRQFGTSICEIMAGRTHVSPISNVTKLPYYFLEDCLSLKTIDLVGFRYVETVSDGFLPGCKNLASIDFSPFCGKVTGGLLPEGLLMGCTSLSKVDISPFSPIYEVPEYFFQMLTGLTEFDTSLLCNVTVIHAGFLEGCTGLTSLDFSPMINVTSIPTEFLRGCSGLRDIKLNGLACNLSEIPYGFLAGCTGLTTIDFSPFASSSVTELPSWFCSFLTGLTTIDLTPFGNRIEVIPKEGFLAGCSSITTINFEAQQNVEELPDSLLRQFTGLDQFDFKKLNRVKYCGRT